MSRHRLQPLPRSQKVRSVEDEALEDLKLDLGIDTKDKDKLLKMILRKAKVDVLDYCRRDDVTENMRVAIHDLSIIRWNRRGNEGEISRFEGGISQEFTEQIPSAIRTRLDRHRKGKMRSLR